MSLKDNKLAVLKQLSHELAPIGLPDHVIREIILGNMIGNKLNQYIQVEAAQIPL